MADQKISQMPSASTLTGAELTPLVQDGVNVQATTSNVVVQTLAITQDIGLNTNTPNTYGGYSTLTIGGTSSNSTGEMDFVTADGNSHSEFYKDGNDLVLVNYPQTNGNIYITAEGGTLLLGGTLIQNGSATEFSGTLQTDTLTGYLYGNGNSGVVTASTSIPNTAISGLGTMSTQNANSVNITGGTVKANHLQTLGLTGFLYGNDTSDVTASTTIPGSAVDFKYGAFQNNATLTNTSPGTGIPMQFNTTDYTNGVSITNDLAGHKTNITIDNAGIYNFQFSAQLNKNGGGGAAIDIYIWMNKNGNPIPDTNTRVTLQGANLYTVAAWNLVFSANAGDKFQLMWGSSSANAEIAYLGTPAIGPEIPAVILTVTQVA